MLQADMSTLPLLSKKDAHSNKLRYLEVKEGMTLITCSGSIGRMTYARKDMEGTWSNQDIMKVVADREKIGCANPKLTRKGVLCQPKIDHPERRYSVCYGKGKTP